MAKYDFTYEEDIIDSYGRNTIGIISDKDGIERPYFFHALKNEEEDEIETCYIYDTMQGFFEHTVPIAQYDWSADNDTMLLMFLNRDINPIYLSNFPFEKGYTELSEEAMEAKFERLQPLF